MVGDDFVSFDFEFSVYNEQQQQQRQLDKRKISERSMTTI